MQVDLYLSIGLCSEVAPLTFGEKEIGAKGKRLHYKGTPFHRIVSGFVFQGVDIVNGDGKGSDCIHELGFSKECEADRPEDGNISRANWLLEELRNQEDSITGHGRIFVLGFKEANVFSLVN
ncbi:hypothetical protein QQ045_000632 [Rhodiola kirilowii]